MLSTEYETMHPMIIHKFIIFGKKDKYGVYNVITQRETECKFDYIGTLYEDSFHAKINGLWGIYNNLGEEILKAEYDFITPFETGYIGRKDKNYGVLDKSKNVVLDFIYTSIEKISNNTFICEIGNKYGIYKSNGEVILPCEYTLVENITTNVIKYANQKKGKIGLILLKQNIVCEEKYDEVEYMGGHVIVWSKGKCTILNGKGEERFPFEFEEIELVCKDPELFAVKQNGKYGIIKHDSSFLVYPKYSKINSFKYGYAVVKDDTYKYGLINIQGYEVLPPVYDGIELVAENYIRVNKGYKYGLLETNGKICLHIIYDYISDISENSATVNLGAYTGKAYFLE